MADPPGKVLSSLTPSSSSDKQQHSKIGGCAGVFFQLFDWNKRLHGKRFFPHKLLPAERKQVSKLHRDEKLPMAKLLLIADENRGGFPRPSQCDSPNGLLKERTPEKKKSGKRAPGVVARLMGLETMPSPEPPRRERQDFDHDKHPSMGKHADEQPHLPVDKGKHTKQKPIDRCPSARQTSSKEINSSFRKENEFQADEKHSGALTRHSSNRVEDLKPMFFYKLPALSPRQSDCALRSILSPSKSHNKLVSPIKSPLASKSAARLFEAAAKILEPSMQPSTRARNLGNVVRPLLVGDGDGEAKGTKKSSRTLSYPKKKPQVAKKQVLSLPAVSDQQAKCQPRSKQENKTINTGDSNAAQSKVHVGGGKKGPPASSQEALKCVTKEDSATSGPRLLRSRSVKEEVGGVKPNRTQQEAKVCREEKSKLDLRRQEQSCRRLSQPIAKSHSLKKAGTKQERDPSTPGALQSESTENAVNRLASNNVSSRTMSSSSVVTSASSNSLTSGSGILNYSRLFSSRKAVSSNDSNKKIMESSQKRGDSSLMKSLLKRKASTTENTTSIARQCVKLKHENSRVNLEPICQTEFSEVTQNTNSLPDESLMEGSCANEDVAADSSIEGVSGRNIEEVDSHSNCIVESLDVSAESIVECEQYGGEQVLTSWDPCETHSLETTFKSSGISNVESSCDSCTDGQDEREDGADTASSYVYPDSGVYRRKEPVSYSGKTTAAILQELLMALNSSRTHAPLDGLPQEKPELMEVTGNSLQHPEIDASVVCSDSMESTLSNTRESSVSSACTMDNSMQETNMVPRAFKCRYQSSVEDCVGTRLQPSPVSTLQCPFQDESSDSFESLQDQKSPCCETSDCTSTIVRQGHTLDDVDPFDNKAFADRNKLLDTISRIHHIDIPSISTGQAMESEEGYIRVIVGAAKLSAEDVYSARLHLSGPLVNPAFFQKIEEQNRQWEWGFFPEDDHLGSCRSEIDLSFTRSLFEEAAVQNRKLVFDCINEALSLNMGIGEESSQNYFLPVLISPAAHLSKTLYRNLNDWRDMACSMNIDDLVEKEMNTGVGRWTDFNSDISEIAMELEGHMLRGLIEELVVELGTRRRNPIPKGGYQSTLHFSRCFVK